MSRRPTLRTPDNQKAYDEYRARGGLEASCILCGKQAIETFTHWKIVSNDFPYDLIASVHHMLVPLRHVQEDEITKNEYREYLLIKKERLDASYDFIISATERSVSIPNHFHLHLVVIKER